MQCTVEENHSQIDTVDSKPRYEVNDVLRYLPKNLSYQILSRKT